VKELIERLEAAPGPDRELDRAIAAACCITWSADEDGNFGGYGLMPRRVHFTGSLDAAMTLLPSTQNWSLETDPMGHYFKTWTFEPQKIWGGQCWRAKDMAASAAIAVCIGALRQRADQQYGRETK
jgi:hypothetical protein